MIVSQKNQTKSGSSLTFHYVGHYKLDKQKNTNLKTLAAKALVKDDKQFMHQLEQKHSDFVRPFVIEQFKYMDPFDRKYLNVIRGDYIQHIHLTGGKLVGQGKPIPHPK